jgi:membrane protein YdbS with pleckstrin-like domain
LNEVTDLPVLAQRAYAAGQLEYAEALFQRVILGGDTAEGFYGVGICRFRFGDTAGAERHFQNALRHNPNHADALYQLGRIADARGASTQAEDFYGKALTANPGHRAAKSNLSKGPRRASADRAVPELIVSLVTDSETEFVGAASRFGDLPLDGKSEPLPSQQPTPPVPTSRLGLASDRTAEPLRSEGPLRSNGTFALDDASKGAMEFGQYDFLLEDLFPTSGRIIGLIRQLRITRRPTYTSFLSAFLFPLLLVAAIGVAAIVIRSGALGVRLRYDLAPIGILVLIFLLPAVFLVQLAVWNSVRYTLDKGRLQVERGILARSTTNIELSRVSDVTLHRSLVNRLTGDGSLFFEVLYPGKTERVTVTGLAKMPELEELRVNILNLIGLLRTHPTVKGLLW